MSTQPSDSLNPAPNPASVEPAATVETTAVPTGRSGGGPGKSFEELFAQLSETARTRPEGSHTVQRLDAGVHAIGKKIVEEAAEVWMAAEHEGNDAAALEISQLLYHVQVMMLSLGLTLDDVYAKL